MCVCFFFQTGLKSFFNSVQCWLKKKKKKSYLEHDSGFVSTSAEIDRHGCPNELLVMTMKIPVILHHICVQAFSPLLLKLFIQPSVNGLVWESRSQSFFLQSSVNRAEGSLSVIKFLYQVAFTTSEQHSNVVLMGLGENYCKYCNILIKNSPKTHQPLPVSLHRYPTEGQWRPCVLVGLRLRHRLLAVRPLGSWPGPRESKGRPQEVPLLWLQRLP